MTNGREGSLRNTVLCCLVLGAAQYLLYSVNFHQFFQGDALFWLHFRFHTFTEFARAFLSLDVAHWYRPLSNRTIPALFYPWFGLNPFGYHVLQWIGLFKLSCLVFLFLRYVTRRQVAAFAGAFYFGIHSLHFYTAYDFAFAPELFYASFYVLAVWLFIAGEKQKSSGLHALSILCGLLSLTSKEAAISLPGMLLLAHLTFASGGPLRAFRALAGHLVVWGAYLAYVVGYLGVGGGDYMLLPRNVARNLGTAIYFALNLRRGVGGWPERSGPSWILPVLVCLAVAGFFLALRLVWKGEGRLIVFGVFWFAIAMTPMLLLNVLAPYYVCLALVGFALVVGMTVDSVWRYGEGFSPWFSRVALALLCVTWWASCRSVIEADTAADTALGYASLWGENSAKDMKAARPELKSGSTVYVLNDAEPELWRYHGIGNLFKLLYNDDTIATTYKSLGQSPSSASGELVVMKVENGHLRDVTSEFQKTPEAFLGAGQSAVQEVERPGVVLSVEPAEVVIGRDFYWLRVKNLGSDEVVVQYTVNDGPVAEMKTRLNPEGGVRFFLSDLTPPGVYRFLRFHAAGSPAEEWIHGGASLVVRTPADGGAVR